MIPKPFEAIARAELQELVANGVASSRTLDFRQRFPGDSVGEKLDFLADVSSMANTSGGDLVYGVAAPEGVAESVAGVAIDNVEVQLQTLASGLSHGIEPRMPGIQLKAVHGFPSGPVVVIRVPQSWAAPHMVTFQGSSRFFGRNNAGKFQLEVAEIRAAFALSESMADRIRKFRSERLAGVLAGTTPMPLAANPKIVVHIVPREAFSIGRQLPGPTLREQRSWFHPISQDSDQLRYNLDGFLVGGEGDPKKGTRGYCQIFRTGIVECVDAGFLQASSDQIPGESFEQELVAIIRSYLQGLQRLDIAPPVFILLSLLGVRGYQMAGPSDRAPGISAAIDRDHVLLPDVMLEEFPDRIEPCLRPMFDALWNASNWSQSPYYREEDS